MKGILTRPRAAIAMGAMAIAVSTAVSVVGSVAPAYADEPGLFCTVTARGTLSAPSPVQFGQFITVQWSADLPDCPAPVLYIDGPGFGGAGDPLVGGSRQVRAITNGSTMTWTLNVFDMETDSRPVLRLASKTITVL